MSTNKQIEELLRKHDISSREYAKLIERAVQSYKFKDFEAPDLTKVFRVSVDSDFDFNSHYARGEFDKIKEEAEKNGDTYSLKQFEIAINNDELFLDNSFIYIG